MAHFALPPPLEFITLWKTPHFPQSHSAEARAKYIFRISHSHILIHHSLASIFSLCRSSSEGKKCLTGVTPTHSVSNASENGWKFNQTRAHCDQSRAMGRETKYAYYSYIGFARVERSSQLSLSPVQTRWKISYIIVRIIRLRLSRRYGKKTRIESKTFEIEKIVHNEWEQRRAGAQWSSSSYEMWKIEFN